MMEHKSLAYHQKKLRTLKQPEIADYISKLFIHLEHLDQLKRKSPLLSDFFVNKLIQETEDTLEIVVILDPKILNIKIGIGTPLWRAAYLGHLNRVTWLLAHKADPNIPDDVDGYTPLILATDRYQTNEKAYKEIILQLLQAGASTDIKDRYGFTAAQYAVGKGLPEKYISYLSSLMNNKVHIENILLRNMGKEPAKPTTATTIHQLPVEMLAYIMEFAYPTPSAPEKPKLALQESLEPAKEKEKELHA